MTANQIAYNKYLEDVRTHQVQEAETHRANLASEAERTRGNTLNYQASIYSTQAGMRNADVNAATQREVAAINSATQLQVASINAATTQRGQDIQAKTAARAQNLSFQTEHNKLAEQKRSNIAQEKIRSTNTVISGITDAVRAGVQLAGASGFLV